MRRIHSILAVVLFTLYGCEWRIMQGWGDMRDGEVAVERYDRIQSVYLTTGDFYALQQLNTEYPMQTRALIEDVLKIGKVNDPEINSKFLKFYQDIVLQSLINEVEQQYANMDDINKDLSNAFEKLRKEVPGIEIPMVYSQIGALDQSIVVGNNTVGISLDKYLGANYPLYLKYYPESQREQMVRSMIVPDCLTFYLLSQYPMPHDKEMSQAESDIHMGKIMWVVNKLTSTQTFKGTYVAMVDRYMKRHKTITVAELLENNDYDAIISSNSSGK